jgi:hypothetical protein
MSSIGTNTVQIWRGELKGPRRRLRLHDRNGINGTGLIRQAYRASMSSILTIQTAANAGAANAIEAAYMALEGTEVSVVDCDGVSHESVLVFAVETRKDVRSKILGGAATSDLYEVEGRWQLMLPYTQIKKGGVTQ